eukprot:3295827-Rhodomonas_salina.1
MSGTSERITRTTLVPHARVSTSSLVRRAPASVPQAVYRVSLPEAPAVPHTRPRQYQLRHCKHVSTRGLWRYEVGQYRLSSSIMYTAPSTTCKRR